MILTIEIKSQLLRIILPLYNAYQKAIIYDLLEHSENYSMTLGSLWNYYRDEIIDDENENENNNMINNSKTVISKSFEYKTKLTGKTQNIDNILNAEVVGCCCSIKIFE